MILKRGSRGDAVATLQRRLGVDVDGVFGAGTEAAVRRAQKAYGLVEDGVVGPATWAYLGGEPGGVLAAVGPARACQRALKDASLAWPKRSRASDGIMGDAAHQARPSDHNLGNAFDITHDPGAGCDAGVLAEQAMTDPRTKYVIWNRRIWARTRAGEGWRPYTGSNPHTHHVHVSINADVRDDGSAWPWCPR